VRSLGAKWNTAKHIAKLFERNKTTLEAIAKMNGIVTYTPADFIKHTYLAIKDTKEFTKSCIEWKAKPLASRSTEIQIRTFFNRKYRVYDAQHSKLAEAGIANHVEMQNIMQAQQNELTAMRRDMAKSLAAERIAYRTYVDQQQQASDNTTVISGMSSMTAL